jgi:uncharacterized Tic20 family protein
MKIELTTPALLFPAISLLLLAYTNRFLTIGTLIRQLKSNVTEDTYVSISQQIDNLRKRLNLIIIMQALGVTSILLCTISMILLFIGYEPAGQLTFAISLFLMLMSLVISLTEILISGKALRIELEEMKIVKN